MPIETSLSRIGRFQFFAIMAPGFYILLTLVLTIGLISYSGDSRAFWSAFLTLVNQMTSYWPLAIGIVFACYLIGIIPRALPVNKADKICGRLFRWIWRNDQFAKSLFEGDFPYPNILNDRLNHLESNGLPARLTLPSDGYALHTLFNFWKVSLCRKTEGVFAYTQDFESRVRLFVGMFWSGAWGVFVSLVGITGCWIVSGTLINSSLGVNLLVATVSAVFVLAFGSRLRFMREDEVTHVFLGYLGLCYGLCPFSSQPSPPKDRP